MNSAKIYNRYASLGRRWRPTQTTTAEATPHDGWTPPKVGQALKIVLYVGTAVVVWALNHYFGGDIPTEDSIAAERPCTPATANDFSPWEPEP